MSNPPEVNFARRMLTLRGLRPPIDVLALCQDYADVEQIAIPIDIDGICLDLKMPGRRPRIILNTRRADKRRRFTLAHELGHVIIPWHSGSIVDETDLQYAEDDYGYLSLEGEANRFASELLMPTDWANEKISHENNPADAVEAISREAETSMHSACVKVSQLLPAGYVWAQVAEGVVSSAGRSPGTIAGTPPTNTALDPRATFPFASERWCTTKAGVEFYWWNVAGGGAANSVEADGDWRQTLDEIVHSLSFADDEATKFKQSLNGIISFANNKVRTGRTRDLIYSACLQRIQSKVTDLPALSRLMHHPRFAIFLEQRVRKFNL